VFFTRISEQPGNPKISNQKEFSTADLALFETKKDKSGDEGLSNTFKFKDIILRDDGGAILIAEEEYLFTRSSQVNGYKTYTTFIANNEICITSISPKGEIEWVRMIPKKEVSFNNGLEIGYALLKSTDSLYFLYNDDKDNLNNSLDTKAVPINILKDAVATLVTVSFDGKMSRNIAFNIKEFTKGLIFPRFCKQLSPNEMFFITSHNIHSGNKMMVMGVLKTN
jgi:hypothetical protein